ncbi:MAG: hypothetical protein ACI8PV_000739 [Dinoroseobacter sp.]
MVLRQLNGQIIHLGLGLCAEDAYEISACVFVEWCVRDLLCNTSSSGVGACYDIDARLATQFESELTLG